MGLLRVDLCVLLLSLVIGCPLKGSETAEATTRPTSVMEAIAPIADLLPRGSDWRATEVVLDRDDIKRAFLFLPNDEKQRALDAIEEVCGYGGTGGPEDREAISLTVMTFKEAQIARLVPQWLSQRFRGSVPLLKLQGIEFDKLEVAVIGEVKADATKIVRAIGKETSTGQAWTNIHVRITRGRRMVELVVRNVPATEKQLISIATETLDRVAGLD